MADLASARSAEKAGAEHLNHGGNQFTRLSVVGAESVRPLTQGHASKLTLFLSPYDPGCRFRARANLREATPMTERLDVRFPSGVSSAVAGCIYPRAARHR